MTDMTDVTKKMRVRIPFAGFYCSIHDMIFDQSLEQINEDRERITIDNVDWGRAHEDYAKAFTGKMAEAIDLPMGFGHMTSPSFYNYDTDQIFASVSQDDLVSLRKSLLDDVDGNNELKDHVAEVLALREGFVPYYSDELEDWGPADTWDAPMMGVLLDFAFLRSDVSEYAIAEDLSDMANELIWTHVRNPAIVPGHVDGPDEAAP